MKKEISKHSLLLNNKCLNCNIEKTLIHSEGIYVCKKCFEVESIIIDSEKPNYKDPTPEKSGYPYKRINHFNEWLSQFQAKETPHIPDDIIENIKLQLKKDRLAINTMTNKRTQDVLKKLKGKIIP